MGQTDSISAIFWNTKNSKNQPKADFYKRWSSLTKHCLFLKSTIFQKICVKLANNYSKISTIMTVFDDSLGIILTPTYEWPPHIYFDLNSIQNQSSTLCKHVLNTDWNHYCSWMAFDVKYMIYSTSLGIWDVVWSNNARTLWHIHSCCCSLIECTW